MVDGDGFFFVRKPILEGPRQAFGQATGIGEDQRRLVAGEFGLQARDQSGHEAEIFGAAGRQRFNGKVERRLLRNLGDCAGTPDTDEKAGDGCHG